MTPDALDSLRVVEELCLHAHAKTTARVSQRASHLPWPHLQIEEHTAELRPKWKTSTNKAFKRVLFSLLLLRQPAEL